MNLQKIKEDNISQLSNYDTPFCEQRYTRGPCYLFVQNQIIWSI